MTDIATPNNVKLAPHSSESEEAVLGAILYTPECFVEVSFLASSDFYILRHRWIFEAMEVLHKEGRDIDNLSVGELLRQQNRLQDIGGMAYLTQLMNSVPSSQHAETYGRMVEAVSIRRDVIARAEAIVQHAYDGSLTAQEVIARSEEEILTVSETRFRTDNTVTALDAVSAYWDELEARHEAFKESQRTGAPLLSVGLPTGLPKLDAMNSGWRKGRLIFIAGRPGHGKTTFMLDQARRQAEAGKSIAFFSFEMTVSELTNKLLASLTGINSLKLDAGQLDEREWGLVATATHQIARWNLQFVPNVDATVRDIRRNCTIIQRQVGLDLVVVDYIQLMLDDEPRHNTNRTQELSAISRGLKKLAMGIDVPFLVGCQLNRSIEGRADKRPMLSDLRESGSLEQDANEVLFTQATEGSSSIKLYLEKCRNGGTGMLEAIMQKETSRIRDVNERPAAQGRR